MLPNQNGNSDEPISPKCVQISAVGELCKMLVCQLSGQNSAFVHVIQIIAGAEYFLSKHNYLTFSNQCRVLSAPLMSMHSAMHKPLTFSLFMASGMFCVWVVSKWTACSWAQRQLIFSPLSVISPASFPTGDIAYFTQGDRISGFFSGRQSVASLSLNPHVRMSRILL